MDKAATLAGKYAVAALPTVLAIKVKSYHYSLNSLWQDGQVLDKFVGAQKEASVREFVEKYAQ